MLLDLFIIRSGAKTTDVNRAFMSVQPMADSFRQVEPEEVLPAVKTSTADWIMLLYDNEWLDKQIQRGLPAFLAAEEYNFYLIFKKVRINGALKHYEAPRIFKRGVEIDPTDFTPAIMQPHTIILDGWILEEDRDG